MTARGGERDTDAATLHHAVLHRAVGLGVTIAASSAYFSFAPETLPGTRSATYLPFGLRLLDHPLALLSITRLTQVMGLAVALGCTYRVIGTLLLLSFGALFNVYWATTGYPVQWVYYLPALLVLVLFPSPPGSRFWSLGTGDVSHSERQGALTAVASIRVWFAVIYLSAFISKLMPPGPLAFAEGGAIQRLFYTRYLDSPLFHLGLNPLLDYSRPSSWFSVLAVCGLAIEASAVIILLPRLPRLRLVAVGAILGMHAALFFAGLSGFLLSAGILALSVLPTSWYGTSRLAMDGANERARVTT